MKLKRYLIELKAVKPIAHGDTLTGVDNSTNVRLFMRTTSVIDGKAVRLPDLSENALRSVIFRKPLHDHLIRFLGIKAGELPQSVVNLLYSGGNMASGALSPTNEIELGHKVKELYPSIDLLGGAVDMFILPRGRLKLTCIPLAKEYLSAIDKLYPEYHDKANMGSIFDWLGEETRTRGTGDESSGNQMLYTYEVLGVGSQFLLELTLDPWTPEPAIGALGLAISEWDGFIGGQSRQGRGRMIIVNHDLPAETEYVQHLEANKEIMRDGLVSGKLGTGRTLCT
jgi:hypothetical protein